MYGAGTESGARAGLTVEWVELGHGEWWGSFFYWWGGWGWVCMVLEGRVCLFVLVIIIIISLIRGTWDQGALLDHKEEEDLR